MNFIRLSDMHQTPQLVNISAIARVCYYSKEKTTIFYLINGDYVEAKGDLTSKLIQAIKSHSTGRIYTMMEGE